MHVNDEAGQSIMLSLFRSRRQQRVTFLSALVRSRILSLSTKEFQEIVGIGSR